MAHVSQFQKLNQQYPQKRAIVTGAGSGLGFAITTFLLAEEWTVLAIDINIEPLRSVHSEKLELEQIDVSDRTALGLCLEGFCKKHKGTDLLFNNAGVGEGSAFKDYPLEHWDWIIDINLKAVIAGTYHVLPYMLASNSGCIINTASMAGIANLPDMSPYNVTKAGVISLSETLAHELSKTKIKIKCVTPAFFQSSILQYSKGDKETIAAAQKVIESAPLSSKDVAVIILKNITNNKEVLRFPFIPAQLFFSTRRLFPSLYKLLVRKFLVK